MVIAAVCLAGSIAVAEQIMTRCTPLHDSDQSYGNSITLAMDDNRIDMFDGHVSIIAEIVHADPVRRIFYGWDSIFYMYRVTGFLTDPFIPAEIVWVQDPRRDQSLTITCEEQSP